MREILFRGKRRDNGAWVYGYYCKAEKYFHSGDEYFIIEYSCDGSQYQVDPATVGQYTGLTDKTGKKIFEGDIIQRKGYIYPLGKQEPCGERIVRGSVIWVDDGRNAGCWCIDSKDEHGNPTTYSFENSFIVVGNIHDNPELLK